MARQGPSSDHLVSPRRGRVLALGEFDGVHRSHEALVDEARRHAELRGTEVVAIVLDVADRAACVMSVRRRCELLVRCGVSSASVLPVSRLEVAAEQLRATFDRVRPCAVVVESESVGALGRASVRSLADGTETAVLPALAIRHPVYGEITAAVIVGRLRTGHVASAGALLGRAFEIEGEFAPRPPDGSPFVSFALTPVDRRAVVPGPGAYAAQVRRHRSWHAAVVYVHADARRDERGVSPIEVHVGEASPGPSLPPFSVAFVDRLGEDPTFATWPRDTVAAVVADDLARATRMVVRRATGSAESD